MKAVLIVIFFLILTSAAALWWGRLSWQQHVCSLFAKLSAPPSVETAFVDLSELDDLPSPVQKYFRRVLKEGAPIIVRARVSQKGGFRATPEMEGWSDMAAEQQYGVRPAGFVWDASITMLPSVTINVCDSYINGHGAVKGRLMSLFSLFDAHGSKELDSGALQRYLAEAVWFPTALLPSPGVTWEAIDDHRAKATLTDRHNSVSLLFGFNDAGEIVSVYSPDRYRENEGTYIPTPWQGHYSRYIDVDGYLIPSEAEVEWHLEEQVYPYWRAVISGVTYE